MKFFIISLGCILFCSVAQADFLTGLLNASVAKVNREKKIQARADELLEQTMKVKIDSEQMAHTYAVDILNESAKLSILAQAGNSGAGKEVAFAEMDSQKVLPCGSDLFATKEGVVTLSLGKKCDSSVSPLDVRRQVEKLGLEKVYCEKNICQIDYNRRK